MSWLVLFLLILAPRPTPARETIVVGSKKFTESVILAETAKLLLAQDGVPATHKAEFGGTRILWNALRSGDIDVYPEYTGTITEEILGKKSGSFVELAASLRAKGVGVLPPLGFNNTYAIGMKESRAAELGISKISDLARYPDLKIGWGDEFRRRKDGWPGMKEAYRLPQRLVRGLDHDIAYRALEKNDIEVTDLYSTDAEIEYYHLRTLTDDLNYFPRYEALFLYNLAAADREPRLPEILSKLSGRISAQEMSALNRAAKLERQPAGKVAADFLNRKFDLAVEHRIASRYERIIVRTREHLKLVLFSLAIAILLAVPLGVTAEKNPRTGYAILGAVGIIQTVPAMALLVVLIHPLSLLGLSGIGDTPAFVALVLYSLLPVVRGTHSGFREIAPALRETATVLGLSPLRRWLRIEFPLALPSILAGIKTAAVMNIGFATLGALVGAGGYGQPILAGIRLDDYGLILEGALPAAILAVLVQQIFDLIEVRLISPGLRK